MSLPSDDQHINSRAVAHSGSDPKQAPAMPIRAQLALFRQTIILTLRYILRPFYRLPIDELRERAIEDNFRLLMDNQRKFCTALDQLIASNNSLQKRLQHYEEHIPRMRDLKHQIALEQTGIRPKSNGAVHGMILPP